MTAAEEWKLVAALNVAKLSADDALATIKRINGHGYGYTGIEQPEIKKLTGGTSSPSINLHVMRLLGRRVGLLSSF